MGVAVRNLVKSFGTVTVIHAISFDVADGEFVTLLGPSGCGKTTTLRCIAGLDVPSGGRIEINGEAASDPARNLFVPPHQRDLGMVFQSYAVWPHLTVAENVAFPLTVKGERDVASGVAWALEVVGMSGLAKRRPSELSGGQQQRVALARAIAARPQLLLFDEPLSNLDARLRDRTRLEISRIQRELNVPTIYVTHDQTEALSMSDRIIVMEAGRIVQEGKPRELYDEPVDRFVADFIGSANFLHVRRVGRQWQLENGASLAVDPATDRDDGRTKIALLRPEAIRLDEPSATTVAGENRLAGRIVSGMYLGPHVEYLVDVGSDRLRVYSRRALAPGSAAVLSFDARDCRLVDDSLQAEAGLRRAG
jgi:iron(III) transport system ATP-binding protein